METIGEQRIFSFGGEGRRAVATTCTNVRKGPAHRVKSFMELATKIAELQFMNRDIVLLFRGQRADHRNRQRNTSLKPSLFRGADGANPGAALLMQRFNRLMRAEDHLADYY